MDKLCDVCGEEPAKYINKSGRVFCRECLVDEYGLCAICANDCKDYTIQPQLCSEFTERGAAE